MTEDQIKASALNLNFTDVDEATSTNVTQPGTIGLFTIKETEYVESTEKGTPGLKCTFERVDDPKDKSEFNHTFWLTPNALTRIQTLAKYALKQKLTGNNTGAQLMAMFKGRQLPLKVTAQINEKKGKVYPDLPYGGFSAETVTLLSFNARENAEIEKSKMIVANTSASNADAEGPSPSTTAPSSQAAADDF